MKLTKPIRLKAHPTRLASDHKKVFEQNGVTFTADISPCSWMYPGYGLQVGITSSVGTIYNHDKKVPFEKATKADFKRLSTVHLAKCSRCSGVCIDHTKHDTNRAGLCETCFISDLNAKCALEQSKEDKRIEREEKRMRAKGFTHRVNAWVHAGGDDYEMVIYSKGEMPEKEIVKRLKAKGSRILNDFWQSTF